MKTTRMKRLRALMDAGHVFAGADPALEERQREARAALHAAADAIEGLPSDAPAEDVEAAERAFNEAETQVTAIDAQIERTRRIAAARSAHPLPTATIDGGGGDGEARVTREPGIYGRWDVRSSYLLDLARANVNGDGDARERLRRHSEVARGEMERRERELERRFDREMAETLRQLPPTLRWAYEQQMERGAFQFAERRDISRTDGAGGEFVPPLWMVDEFIALARAGRVLADLVRQAPLPSGTDSLNIPKVATGTAVAAQASDNAAVQETDLTTSSINAPVRTIAGQQDIALQLLEQSPIAFDQVVFEDLAADYALKLNTQVGSGAGSSGTLKGFTAATGINVVTYTDTTPTVPELWPKLADALNRAQTSRLLPATAWVMHPRRWYWMVAALGTDNRPLITIFPQAVAANSLGVMQENAAAGPVGTLMGLPVYLDPTLPTNLGAGTNEDIILTARFSDSWLFEGAMRTRALPEVLSGTLTVRLQLYCYVAFTAERYGNGISEVGGSGLAAPTF